MLSKGDNLSTRVSKTVCKCITLSQWQGRQLFLEAAVDVLTEKLFYSGKQLEF